MESDLLDKSLIHWSQWQKEGWGCIFSDQSRVESLQQFYKNIVLELGLEQTTAPTPWSLIGTHPQIFETFYSIDQPDGSTNWHFHFLYYLIHFLIWVFAINLGHLEPHLGLWHGRWYENSCWATTCGRRPATFLRDILCCIITCDQHKEISPHLSFHANYFQWGYQLNMG